MPLSRTDGVLPVPAAATARAVALVDRLVYLVGVNHLASEHVRTVGAYDAKSRLSSLLDQVERGEEIVITRHGRPIARLVPVHRGHDVAAALRAVDEITEMREKLEARGVRVTMEEILSMRDEGRR